jgi:uracil phosphoribosyltransferase
MTGPFPNLRVLDHPLIRTKLTLARDRGTGNADFRRLMGEIGALMAYEVTHRLPLRDTEVETPMERTAGVVLALPVTLVPILRAGLGLLEGFLSVMPEARVGHVGVQRNEASLAPVPYYAKFPRDVAAGPVILVDPMIATGGTACHAADVLRQRGCMDVVMACLVASPQGIRRMAERHPDLTVFAASLDRELDATGYIRPGIGDAGDRTYGTEKAGHPEAPTRSPR